MPTLLIAIASGVVLGIAALFLVYKMVDGDLVLGAGLSALVAICFVMALAIHPPHPVIPGVVLVCALSLLAFFPYAEQKLEELELRGIGAGQLAKSFEAVRVRPDNFSAKLDLARRLHEHGFRAHAIHLAAETLNSLNTEKDEVQNRSMRDIFSREEALLRRWQSSPVEEAPVRCPRCGASLQPSILWCPTCGTPYLLEVVQAQEIKPRVWARLVFGWAAIALLIPACVSVAMNLDGILRSLAFVLCVALVGSLLAWLFRPPRYAPKTM